MIDRLSKSFFKSFQKLRTIGDYDLIDINLVAGKKFTRKKGKVGIKNENNLTIKSNLQFPEYVK